MRLKQYLLAASGVLLLFILFFFGKIRFPEGKSVQQQSANRDKPARGTEMNFEQLLSLASQNLSAADSKKISLLNEKLSSCKTKSDSAQVMKHLGDAWYDSKNYIVAGVYFETSGKATNNIALLDSASQSLAFGYTMTKDTNAMVFGAEKTLECFQLLRNLQPNNLDYKIGYAATLIDGMGDVMSGVSLLKEVEKQDPENLQMNLILGRLDIRNGELDKSVSHLQKVLKKDPKNLDAYLYLAEVWKAKGNNKEELKELQAARKLSNDDGLNQSIDKTINELRTK